MSTDPVDTAERIIKFADREITVLPDEQQEAALRQVMQEITSWLEAIKAGREYERGPAPDSIAHLQKTDPEEWQRRFREFQEWVKSLPKTPPLSDEAMSRESIYPDRS